MSTPATNGHLRINRQLVDSRPVQQCLPVPNSASAVELDKLNGDQLAVLLQLAELLSGKTAGNVSAETFRITFTEED